MAEDWLRRDKECAGGRRRRWPGNFAEVFFVADAAHAATYLSRADCPFLVPRQ